MKITDKDEAAQKAFEESIAALARQSFENAKVAAMATRSAGSTLETEGIPVNVRAFARKGLDGFRRGGHFWPSAGIDALVTQRLFNCLEAEPMLRVHSALEPEKLGGEVLDLPEAFSIPVPSAPKGASATEIAAIVAAAVAEAIKATAPPAPAVPPAEEPKAKAEKPAKA